MAAATERASTPAAEPPPNLLQFLHCVLPANGRYAAFEMGRKQHIWCDSIEGLAAAIEARRDVADIYFATSSFKSATTRTAANVQARRSFCFDIDAGPAKVAKHGIGKVYADNDTALRAVVEWCKRHGVTPTAVVHSGTGLHVYFVLDHDICTDEWLPLAASLKARALADGLKIDASVTGDAARILRPIGSLHNNGHRVRLLGRLGPVHRLAGFQRIASAPVAPAQPLPTRKSINAEVLDVTYNGPPASLALVVSNCAAVRHAVDQKGNVPEPYWRAMLGVVKHTDGGEKAAHDASRGHPGYDAVETQAKLDHWTCGPATCATFESENAQACARCAHRGKLKSPITLGAPSAPADPAVVTRDAGMSPVMGTDGRVWLDVKTPTTRRAIPLAGGEARDVIRVVLKRSMLKHTDQAVEAAIADLRVQAVESTTREHVHLRAAKQGAAYYLDIGDGAHVARIGAGTVNMVSPHDAPLFASGTGAGAFPPPEVPATAPDALRTLTDHFGGRGVPKHALLPLVVALMECLRPDTPYPILSVVGPAGCGKSSMVWEAKQCADPTNAPSLPDVRYEEKDIAASAQHMHVLVVDNVSHLSPDQQDFACKVSTGVYVMSREYYTTTGVEALSIHRPLFMTSIGTVATRADLADLADRTVTVELQARDGFQSLQIVRAEFEAKWPALVGSLLRLLASALEHLPLVRERHPRVSLRLADFALLGEAVCAAANMPEGFTTHMQRLRRGSAISAAESDAFMQALVRVIFRHWATATMASDTHPSDRQWQRGGVGHSVIKTSTGAMSVRCTAGALLNAVRSAANGMPRELAQMLPVTARGVGESMRRVQPTMRDIGWHFEATAGRVSTFQIDIGPDAYKPAD